MNEYACVWDIAKRRDFTAGLIVRKTPEIVPGNPYLKAPDRVVNFLDIVHIDKFNALTYPQMVERISLRVGHADLANNCDLVVDGTGVGEAAVDIMRDSGLNPIPIVFTAGNQVQTVFGEIGSVFTSSQGKLSVARTVKEIHVPKVDLVEAGKLLSQQDRVRCDPDLRWADDFKAQMQGFRGKVNERTGRTRYENESDGLHDDLIVCYLMAAWWMLREHDNEVRDRVTGQDRDSRDWSPYDFM